MDVISQCPSNAASKASTSATSSKPTPVATKTTKTTNGRNVKSAVNDDASEDDPSEEEMNCDKQSGSDDNEVLRPFATVCSVF